MGRGNQGQTTGVGGDWGGVCGEGAAETPLRWAQRREVGGGLRGWEGGEGGGWVTWYPGRCLPTSSVLSQPSGIGPAPPAPALRLCLCLPPAVRCLPHPWVGPCCGPGPGPQCGPARWPRPAREPPHLRRLSTWEASLVPLGKPRWFAMLPWPLGLLRGLGCPRTVCGP